MSPRSTHLLPKSTHMDQRSTHIDNRSTHLSYRLTHLQNNQGSKPFKYVIGLNINNKRSNKKNKNYELIYKIKDQVKNQESKSISVKQVWIPKCLFNILDTLKDLNRTKQVWVPKSSI